MSETTQTPAPAEEYVPQHVLSSETNEDATQPLQAPEQPAEPEQEPPAEKPPEDAAKAERRRESQRIAALTRLRYQEKARADAAEAKLRELDPNAGAGGPSREEVERWVDERAEQKLQQKEWAERFSAWDSAGQETYGRERFLEACQTMANLASGSPAQRAALVDVALDIDGGQRAIVELADNPEEAERVLALPPHRMALAVQKLAGEAATKPSVAGRVQPVSNAPAPIRPPAGGRARSDPDPERGTMDSYAKWSAQQKWRS